MHERSSQNYGPGSHEIVLIVPKGVTRFKCIEYDYQTLLENDFKYY